MRAGATRTRECSRSATSSRRAAPRTSIAPWRQELWAGIALTGLRERRSWSASRDRADVFDAKGLGELVLAATGAPGSSIERWAAGTGPRRYLEEGRAAGLAVDGRAVGWFGELARGVRDTFDLPAPVFVAELSLTALGALPQAVPRYQPLPRFPPCSGTSPSWCRGCAAGDVEAHLRQCRRRLLTRARSSTVYQGDQVAAGRRSLAFSLTYQAPDRTLTDREVNDVHATIVAEIRARLRAEIEGRIMAENLSQRLEHLERSVTQAAEAIGALRKEREGLQARIAAMEQDRVELQSLRQERKDVLAQVDGILKELDKLEL